MAPLSFICHSSKDAAIAQRIVEKLESNGISCWIAPRNIPPGLTYSASIINGIKNAAFFIFIFTKSSNESDAVINEIENASALKIRIIPLKMDDLAYSDSLEYYLRSKQAINAFNRSLDTAVAELVQHINVNKITTVTDPLPGPTPRPKQSSLKNIFIAAAIIIILFIIIFYIKAPHPGGLKNAPNTRGQADSARPAEPSQINTTARIYSQGRLTIVGSYIYDMDLGKQLTGDLSNPNIDIFFEFKNDVERYFNPEYGAYHLLGKVDFNSITAKDLAGLSYSNDKINASNNEKNQLSPGTVVAVKTHDGRYTKFKVDAYGTGQWGTDIEISWVTYELVK